MAVNSKTFNLWREKWEQHCEEIQSMTSVELSSKETPAERDRRKSRLLSSYADFCEYYFPHYLTQRDKVTGEVSRTVHNAPFHNEAARYVRSHANTKAVFMWPRGHAKSTHFDVFMPLWLMFQSQPLIHVGVIVGKSEDSAKTLLSSLQAELEFNQRIIADFGEQKNVGDWQDGEFVTMGGIAWFARGRGQSPRGLRYKEARPDYIVIDDLDDDELCKNEKRVGDLTDWVKEALFGTLDVGRGRFIMVGNLIAKNSVLYNIAHSRGVHLSRVDALDGEGNPVWRDKWTKEEAQATAEFMGYRAWNKEFMNNPIRDGSIFRADWIRFKKMLPLKDYVQLVCYTDPSWKSSSNDYKACRLWGKTASGELHLLRSFVRQDTTTHMVRWLYDLYEWSVQKGVTIYFYMEANFMQDLILDEFEAEGRLRGYQLPIKGDKRKKPDKVQRIEAISPLWERGLVFYNAAEKDSPDMQTGIDQTLALEHGSRQHDDAPDADESAIWFLQRATRQQTMHPVVTKRPRYGRSSW